MAFGKRTPPAAPSPGPAPVTTPSEAELRAGGLADRKETLERRREAIRSEAEALRKAIDSAAERGEDASADAASLLDADRRLAAIALEITAAGRALDSARAVVAEEARAAEAARLEREYETAAAAFDLAERRFRQALAAFSETIGPALRAHRALDRAAAAAGRQAATFYADRADDELRDALRRAGADTETLGLAVPYAT